MVERQCTLDGRYIVYFEWKRDSVLWIVERECVLWMVERQWTLDCREREGEGVI